MREPHEPFAVQRLGRALGVGDGVADAVVDGRDAGRVRVAEIAHLHGRGSVGEGEQPRVQRVAREVDEDVDAVLANEPRQLRVGSTPHVSPAVRQRPHALGGGVGVLDVGVAGHLDGGPIVGAQQRCDEERDRVLPEVRRDVADAQPPPSIEVSVEVAAVVAPALGGAVVGVLRGPAAVLGEDLVGAAARGVRQQEQQVRVRASQRGVERDRAPVGVDRLLEARLAVERDGEILPGQRVVRLERDRAPVVLDRLAEQPALTERGREVVLHGRVVRAALGSAA